MSFARIGMGQASDSMMDDVKETFPAGYERIYNDTDDSFKEWRAEMDEAANNALGASHEPIRQSAATEATTTTGT